MAGEAGISIISRTVPLENPCVGRWITFCSFMLGGLFFTKASKIETYEQIIIIRNRLATRHFLPGLDAVPSRVRRDFHRHPLRHQQPICGSDYAPDRRADQRRNRGGPEIRGRQNQRRRGERGRAGASVCSSGATRAERGRGGEQYQLFLK